MSLGSRFVRALAQAENNPGELAPVRVSQVRIRIVVKVRGRFLECDRGNIGIVCNDSNGRLETICMEYYCDGVVIIIQDNSR